MSEEFGGALPSAILAEQRRLPVGFLEQVIEYRAYAAAYAAFGQNPKAEGEMVDLVKEIQFYLVREEIERKKRDAQ